MKAQFSFKDSTLKIVAAVAMLIDHTGIILNNILPQWAYMVFRGIGRISFPIFAFFIVSGFLNTGNFWKYFIRMVVFAILSEVPFDLLTSHSLVNPEANNVMFTFVIALAVLYTCQWGLKNGKEGKVISVAVIIGGMAAAWYLKTDYSWRGVLLIVVIYYAWFYRTAMYALGTIVLCLKVAFLGVFAPLAFIFLHFYDGKHGKMSKWFFYIFYPVHIIILVIIRRFIYG